MPAGLLSAPELRKFNRAEDFLWAVRCHLHLITGRAEERLTFDLQPVVGARMGYTRHGKQDGVERFMKHLFLTAREVVRLKRLLEPAIERAALGMPALQPAPDEAMKQAGLTLADQIVAVDGQAWSADRMKAAIVAAKGTKTPIPLTVKRGEAYRSVALDYHGGLRYPRLEKTGTGDSGLDRLLAAR